MSEGEVNSGNSEVNESNPNDDYPDGIRDFLTPPTSLQPNPSNEKIVILYVIGVFLAVVLLLAMAYILKLNLRTWIPKRKHFCDFRDCFRQSNGKKRKFFQRNTHKTNFTIPVVVVSDENGHCLDPEAFVEEFETKGSQAFP